jgi:hypothetical protein
MSEEEQSKGKTITIKKDTLWKASTFVFAVLFVIVLITSIGPNGQVVSDTPNTGISGIDKYVGYAEDLGLDASDFRDCVEAGADTADINAEMQYGASLGVTGTPGFLVNGRLLKGAQPFAVFKEMIDEELAGTAGSVSRVNVDIEGSYIKGEVNAPVTIVEFSDYECPYCTRHFEQTYGQIVSEYVDTGKVKLVFMDFPLSFHTKAIPAAQAARCAGEQGDYWGMHDSLFTFGV